MKDSNNPPDVELSLTHEQATFLLENCNANARMGLAMIMSFADVPGTLEEKRAAVQPIVELNEKFQKIRKLLRDAGAREKED